MRCVRLPLHEGRHVEDAHYEAPQEQDVDSLRAEDEDESTKLSGQNETRRLSEGLEQTFDSANDEGISEICYIC